MAATGSDISIVLSGGSGNLDPNLSLGGDPSASPVTDNSLNNLFDDVNADEVDAGHEDYRALYLFNDGLTDIFDGKLWILDDFAGGSTVEMGVEQRNETQRITVTGIPSGGYMDLEYSSVQFRSTANTNLGIWATQLQDQLNSLELSGDPLLQDVVVAAQLVSSGTVIFDIQFAGVDGKRTHPKITLVSNSLTPSSSISISTPSSGSPVNTIAPQINVDTTPPGGVGFFVPTEQSPISIPKLKSGDGFPFWIKRTTPVDVSPVENDGFTFRFVAEALQPQE